MIEAIRNFIDTIKAEETEIYNEFSLQHELGVFLRSRLPDMRVQFERNVSFFFSSGEFVKKEIDISIYSADKSRLQSAIELKFPRNGQYPEQMFSFCKDIRFLEQLKRSGFERTFFVVFADDPLFYSGNGAGIYGFFRNQAPLEGSIVKPTGRKDESVTLDGRYCVQWNEVLGNLKYATIETTAANKEPQPTPKSGAAEL